MQTEEQGSKGRYLRVRDFFYHLIVYVFVLAILFFVMGDSAAFVWIALGWGLGVALHGVYAYFG